MAWFKHKKASQIIEAVQWTGLNPSEMVIFCTDEDGDGYFQNVDDQGEFYNGGKWVYLPYGSWIVKEKHLSYYKLSDTALREYFVPIKKKD